MSETGRIDLDSQDAVKSFILANTPVLTTPLVPEVRLHLAEESMPIWRRTEEELGEMNLPPPFWAFAWTGGQALSRYILDRPETCRGKRVLDLGAGSGLCAISAWFAGAHSVIAAQLNCALNNAVVEATSADWLRELEDAEIKSTAVWKLRDAS